MSTEACECCIDEGLAATAVRTRTWLPHNKITETLASRVLIEQVTGALMLLYDLDADNAFELLKWGSQTTDGDLHRLARQVARVPADDVAALRAACDDLLFP